LVDTNCPGHEGLEDDFPFQTGDFQVPSVNFSETNSSPGSKLGKLGRQTFPGPGDVRPIFWGKFAVSVGKYTVIYLFGSKAVRGMMKKVRLREFWSAGMPMSYMLYDSHITSGL